MLLKNSERFPQSNRLIEILYERDFLYDKSANRDFIKIDDRDIFISPLFRLILHVNTPISVSYQTKSNHLFQRLNSPQSAAHACIDFALSREFIANELLAIVMEHEKPGYLNQMLLFDKIRLDSEASIFLRQEDITERLYAIKGSLLDDRDLIQYVASQNVKLKNYQEALSEALNIE